jgi:hypothetical protein
MTEVTAASIAYIATQVRLDMLPLPYTTMIPRSQLSRSKVRFAMTSCHTFCQTEKVSDSEGFYIHIIDLLEDPDEQAEVADLLKWYNQ